MSIVCKFGGTSLATPENVGKALRIAQTYGDHDFHVVSAPGSRGGTDPKVTDLIRSACRARSEKRGYALLLTHVADRFRNIISGLGLELSVEGHLEVMRDAVSHGQDALAESRGECIMARIFAQALGRPFYDAADIIRFDDRGFNGLVTYDLIETVLPKHPGAIIPGYYGSTFDGRIVLFSRGGGDVTGSHIAHGIRAERCVNWTDVNGVLSADPRRVPGARTIPRMTHRELRTMAAAGAGVMHPAAVKPVFDRGIPIEIRNTFDPGGPYTLVDADTVHERGTVIAVVGSAGFTALTVSDTGVYDLDDFYARVGGVLHKHKRPGRHTSDDFDDVTYLIEGPSESLEDVTAELGNVFPTAEIDTKPAARIALVGSGMRESLGFLGRVALTLGETGVNILTVSQSAREHSITFGIPEDLLEEALRALHDVFVEQV